MNTPLTLFLAILAAVFIVSPYVSKLIIEVDIDIAPTMTSPFVMPQLQLMSIFSAIYYAIIQNVIKSLLVSY